MTLNYVEQTQYILIVMCIALFHIKSERMMLLETNEYFKHTWPHALGCPFTKAMNLARG